MDLSSQIKKHCRFPNSSRVVLYDGTRPNNFCHELLYCVWTIFNWLLKKKKKKWSDMAMSWGREYCKTYRAVKIILFCLIFSCKTSIISIKKTAIKENSWIMKKKRTQKGLFKPSFESWIETGSLQWPLLLFDSLHKQIQQAESDLRRK